MAAAVRPDRAGSVGDYVDWKRQAEDMAWFVASVDGEDAGAALAYVGWHSAPGTGTGEAFVLPEHRGAGVGSALYRELASWVEERGCVTLETTVAEDDAASLAWADRRGFREIGRSSRLVLDLTAIEAPAVDPPEGVEIVTWAERPDLTPRALRGGLRGVPGRARARRARRWTPYEDWLSKDMRGDSDRPEATFIALADGEVAGYAKLSLSSSRREGRPPRHDRRAARLPRTRHRRGAEARRDRLGEAGGLRDAWRRATRCGTSRSAASTSATATRCSPASSSCTTRSPGSSEPSDRRSRSSANASARLR